MGGSVANTQQDRDWKLGKQLAGSDAGASITVPAGQYIAPARFVWQRQRGGSPSAVAVVMEPVNQPRHRDDQGGVFVAAGESAQAIDPASAFSIKRQVIAFDEERRISPTQVQ